MADIRTHYDNLKVSRDAPDSVIRAAYRTLSQQYHPDKRPNDERAARIMAIINQSYEVLSDPEKRRSHDAWITREEAKHRQRAQPKKPPIPPQWQHPAPPPPNSPGALEVFLLWPFKIARNAIAAFPQLALLALLLGGYLTWMALSPKRAPVSPPPGPKPFQAEAPKAAARAVSDCRKVAGDARVFTYLENGVRHYTSKLPAECNGLTQRHSGSAPPVAAKPDRVRTAPNGSPWPKAAAYVRGYPVDNDDGYSNVTVDNSENSSDVFAKLITLEGDVAFPVRQFFIPAGSKFTMKKVASGSYDIRYRDLESGQLSRSETFDVEERRTRDGVEYSNMTMTLYKVLEGNFKTYALSEADF